MSIHSSLIQFSNSRMYSRASGGTAFPTRRFLTLMRSLALVVFPSGHLPCLSAIFSQFSDSAVHTENLNSVLRSSSSLSAPMASISPLILFCRSTRIGTVRLGAPSLAFYITMRRSTKKMYLYHCQSYISRFLFKFKGHVPSHDTAGPGPSGH